MMVNAGANIKTPALSFETVAYLRPSTYRLSNVVQYKVPFAQANGPVTCCNARRKRASVSFGLFDKIKRPAIYIYICITYRRS